jgi:hypothetical protein
MKITREIVIDLWPVYQSGEASSDTRELVEEYLRGDSELERRLRSDDSLDALRAAPPALSTDHEMETFRRTRRAVHKIDWTLFLAMMFSCFAFGRIVSDTSWDVSPRNFAVVAGIATIFWIAFFVRLVRKLSVL